MTAPALVPAADIVHDIIDGRLTYREALAILRARGLNADITVLYQAVHEQRRDCPERLDQALRALSTRAVAA